MAGTKNTITFDVNSDLVISDDLNLYLLEGEKILAFATSCTLELSADSIDTSNKLSPSWATTLQGKSSYTISADALFTSKEGAMSFDELMKAMIARKPIQWAMGYATDIANGNYDLDTSKNNYKGKANVTSCSLNAGNNECASCSISLTGNGAIDQVAGV